MGWLFSLELFFHRVFINARIRRKYFKKSNRQKIIKMKISIKVYKTKHNPLIIKPNLHNPPVIKTLHNPPIIKTNLHKKINKPIVKLNKQPKRVQQQKIKPHKINQILNQQNKYSNKDNKYPFTTQYNLLQRLFYKDFKALNKSQIDKFKLQYQKKQESNIRKLSKRISQFLVVLFFNIVGLAIIAFFLCRSISAYLQNYKSYLICQTLEQLRQDSGWKRIQRQVFRAPKDVFLLSTLIGLGAQIIATVIVCAIGFTLNHQSKWLKVSQGKMLNVILFTLFAHCPLAGYVSSRLYKMWFGTYWLIHSIFTNTIIPTILLILLYMVYFLQLMQRANHFGLLYSLQYTIIIVIMPIFLGLIGSFLGLKATIIKHPCGVNPIEQYKKAESWLTTPLFLIASLIPFMQLCFIRTSLLEIIYLLDSVWVEAQYQFYIVFLGAALMLILTSGEISILVTYHRLNSMDPKWWWLSFKIPALSALYVFIFSMLYFFIKVQVSRFSSILLYFIWVSVLSSCYLLFCGSAGFIFTFFFVRKIYSMIKPD